MRRKLIFSCAVLLLFSMLCGCAPKLPDGFSEDDVRDKANEIILMLNQQDFDAIEAATREDLREVMRADKTEEALAPLLSPLGQQVKAPTMGFTKTEDATTGEVYVVCVAVVKYEGGRATYTLSFNKDLELVGLFMK